MSEEKTITQQIHDIAGEFCNKYCKYPELPIPEGKDENWLMEDDDSPCNTCPLVTRI